MDFSYEIKYKFHENNNEIKNECDLLAKSIKEYEIKCDNKDNIVTEWPGVITYFRSHSSPQNTIDYIMSMLDLYSKSFEILPYQLTNGIEFNTYYFLPFKNLSDIVDKSLIKFNLYYYYIIEKKK